MQIPEKIAQEIIEVGSRLYTRALLAGTDGNISVRLDKSQILITASGVCKGRMKPNDLTLVDYSGRRLDGERAPSSEMAVHLLAMNERPDIHACVHAHPPYATSFAVSGGQLPDDVLPEVVVFVGSIAHVPYAPPGTKAVPDAVAPFIKTHNAFLLRNHGVVTIGRTLEEAYNRLETVEHFAKILHLATQLGAVDRIPKADFERLKEMHRKLTA
jgi:L-fuculose-phosphate aldolase